LAGRSKSKRGGTENMAGYDSEQKKSLRHREWVGLCMSPQSPGGENLRRFVAHRHLWFVVRFRLRSMPEGK